MLRRHRVGIAIVQAKIAPSRRGRCSGFLVLGGFTPIPMKVFTWASGIVGVPMLPFMASMLIGRGKRVYLVARGDPPRRRARGSGAAPLHRADGLDRDGAAGRPGRLAGVEAQAGMSADGCACGCGSCGMLLRGARAAGGLRQQPAWCAGRAARAPPPRVSDAEAGATAVVQRGDTLYGIAIRNGIDVRDLAAWNGIAPPYTIYPGPAPAAVSRAARRRAHVDAASARRPPPRRRRASDGAPRPAADAGRRAARRPSQPDRWRWPADGAIVGRFVAGEPTKQGIDIAGNSGAPVRAAADGVVVYSGAGLVGYGELIIIKHSDAVAVGLRPQPQAPGQRRPAGEGRPADRRDGPQRRRARHAALRDPLQRQAGRSAAVPAQARSRTRQTPPHGQPSNGNRGPPLRIERRHHLPPSRRRARCRCARRRRCSSLRGRCRASGRRHHRRRRETPGVAPVPSTTSSGFSASSGSRSSGCIASASVTGQSSISASGARMKLRSQGRGR